MADSTDSVKLPGHVCSACGVEWSPTVAHVCGACVCGHRRYDHDTDDGSCWKCDCSRLNERGVVS